MHFLQDKKILITGSSGYIAGALIEILKSHNCLIIRQSNSPLSPINGIADFLDINKPVHEIDINLHKPDIIIHLAAQTSSRYSNNNPEKDAQINLLPLITILNNIKLANYSPHFLFASTCTIYGNTEGHSTERNPPHPNTVYDLNKLCSENYIRLFTELGLIKGASLRLSNVYGPGISTKSKDRGILKLFAQKLLNSENIQLYGSGAYLRDYIFINDVANAFLALAKTPSALDGSAYNVCSGKSTTLKNAIELIKNILIDEGVKSNSKVDYTEEPSDMLDIDKRNFQGSNELLKLKTEWSPRTTLEEGLNQTIRSLS